MDKKERTFWGASPIIFLLTTIFSILIIIINYYYRYIFEMSFIPYLFLKILAIFLLCIGIPSYIYTAKKLKTGFKEQKLITKGIFSLCRNPLFAEVIFLILPGIVLFFNSWLLLTIPCFMLVMFKIFIPREEMLLQDIFGNEYAEYKKNTTAIFPRL